MIISKLFVVVNLLLSGACSNNHEIAKNQSTEFVAINGETMGTYYGVKLISDVHDSEKIKSELDSILIDVNLALSTYIDSSLISVINGTHAKQVDLGTFRTNYLEYFLKNWSVAKQVYLESEGYYDPTVMPLVNYWGFGYQRRNESLEPEQYLIDSLVQLVGFDSLKILEKTLFKPNLAQVDYSSLAKGFGVDVLMDYLRNKGFDNLMVDIGGEVKTRGGGKSGMGWRIGVAKPEEGSAYQELEMVLNIKDKAIASSGNYINFYRANGQKFVHTVDPFTGFTKQSNLLAATVIMDECIYADAWATAFMSMGFVKAREHANKIDNADVLLIYNDNETLKYFMTEGFRSYIIQ